MSDATKLVTIVEAYFAAIRAADRSAWLATFAPDGRSEDPAGTPAKTGYAELGEFFDEMMRMLSRTDLRPLAVHVCGDRAAVSWEADLEARNGRTTRCTGIDLFEFDAQGRIGQVTGFWDPQAAFAALGLP